MSSVGWTAFDSRGGAEWLRTYIEKKPRKKTMNYDMLTNEELIRTLDVTPDLTKLERLLVERLDAALMEINILKGR